MMQKVTLHEGECFQEIAITSVPLFRGELTKVAVLQYVGHLLRIFNSRVSKRK